jgi:hypothetical protein
MDDNLEIGLGVPPDPNSMDTVFNTRFANTQKIYEKWLACGAVFFPHPPIDRTGMTRYWMFNPGGHPTMAGQLLATPTAILASPTARASSAALRRARVGPLLAQGNARPTPARQYSRHH